MGGQCVDLCQHEVWVGLWKFSLWTMTRSRGSVYCIHATHGGRRWNASLCRRLVIVASVISHVTWCLGLCSMVDVVCAVLVFFFYDLDTSPSHVSSKNILFSKTFSMI
jgi:hypothetical protein